MRWHALRSHALEGLGVCIKRAFYGRFDAACGFFFAELVGVHQGEDTMTDETRKEDAQSTSRLNVFKDPPASIKTLRRSYKDRLKLPDQYNLQGELAGESERASIILLATLLDDALITRLSQCLCFRPEESEFEHVFRFEGPLETFSARMEIACLFGFIDDATYQQLNIIREMRNACAHSKHAMVFSDPVLANVTKRLFQPLGFLPQPPRDDPKELKGGFIVEGIFIFHTLISGSRVEGAKIVTENLRAAAAAVAASPDTQKEQQTAENPTTHTGPIPESPPESFQE